MNKEEVVKLADICDIDLYPESRNGIDRDALIAFANACEKIGMEKAAKLCRDASLIDGNAHLYADAILEATK